MIKFINFRIGEKNCKRLSLFGWVIFQPKNGIRLYSSNEIQMGMSRAKDLEMSRFAREGSVLSKFQKTAS